MKVSSGQAAQMVSLSKKAFIEMPSKYGISQVGNSINELHPDRAKYQDKISDWQSSYTQIQVQKAQNKLFT